MAPVPFENIPDILVDIRQVEQDTPTIPDKSLDLSSPATFAQLAPRSDSSSSAKPHYGAGSVDPNHIKMQGLFALFAIIGAAFVIAAIWFFFWAKNGGFVWRKGDWEDYKSTVLRRKGPDGRTLSNATKSTKLGGGSIFNRGYTDDGYTYTDETQTQTASSFTDEKPKKKRLNFKDKILRRRKEELWEGEGDEDVRLYREEKPARMSDVRDYAYEQPRRSKRRDPSGFSFTAGSEDVLSQATEERHPRDPSSRRDPRREQRRHERKSAVPSAPSSRTSSPRKEGPYMTGGAGYTEPLDFSSRGARSNYQYSNVDTEESSGTKSYHHPIPGLNKGYRRDDRRDGRRSRRRDSLSDSDGDDTRYS
ncbi:hypothetical protein N7468_008564 [Penicillium chermesinum]|uniref:Endosomal SPRY domain protein n=1 Tax=Penicillium chermesinum TaxID=63820 RepID=A0A9W9NQ01_9EURO|nr:uncharacterized protein N7468_008564 [Penicillium chermesinum]KAJ5224022.1 hypothetical protein N7468_008564 [Penicillium chermesinum]